MKYCIDPKVEIVASKVVDALYRVHRSLGPGLLESVYETCFCHELLKQGLSFRRQVPAPLIYDQVRFECVLRLDVLVQELIICELKAVDALHPIDQAQLLTYLKLTNKRLGFLVNFNVVLIKDGIKRLVL
ncbi:MAG: GxxExxY protein [Acidobacteria bacterium]|nr:MAG: GxxExxY protein [Acidobacteriota bacterium]